jgi:hypothetical protein
MAGRPFPHPCGFAAPQDAASPNATKRRKRSNSRDIYAQRSFPRETSTLHLSKARPALICALASRDLPLHMA